ncbi:MAG: hypothetical protein ACOY3P_21345 [Planctomycetota bacterium]
MSRPTPTIHCVACGYAGPVLTAHHGYKWWMLPLGFLLAATGCGFVVLAIILIWMGNRTYSACPSCCSQQLQPWAGEPSPEDLAVWQQAYDADAKAFERNKYILFGVVMAMLLAALVFMFVMLQNV